MTNDAAPELDALWSRHHAEWRDTAQVASHWAEAAETDPRLLRFTVRGAWWDVLAETGATLLVTREYEHLVIAMHAAEGRPSVSYMRMPHPSGLVADRARGVVHVASTRNPNQVFDLRPVSHLAPRGDVAGDALDGHPLVPTRARFYPGSTYLHDLAIIGGELCGNAVGENAVVRLGDNGETCRAWWPRAIEGEGGPRFERNYLQLNSIAAGDDLATSYFSASTDRVSARRPGHRNFAVDGRGVIFSGATREVVARGLTRPHSARLHGGRLWVDNSGYGTVGIVEGGGVVPVLRLPGWTRGLAFHGRVAFVGTSRVIPRFRHYAPGLDADASRCGVHAVDTASGALLGSLFWPFGNQIFAIDWLPRGMASGFPFAAGGKRATRRAKDLFYAFRVTPPAVDGARDGD